MNAILQRRWPQGMPCAQWGEDDGVDPRKYFDRRRRDKPCRKALQLCAQVGEALAYAFGEDVDGHVQALTVLGVEPCPDSTRLLVTAGLPGWVDAIAIERSLASLHAAQARLRCKVAAAIHRRKTPNLVFRVIGMADAWEVGA